MNVKQTSINPNINYGQAEEFSSYEEIESVKGKELVCTKEKKIKITPMYKIHKTKGNEVIYKVELLKYTELFKGFRDYAPITSEAYNVSADEMRKFMNFLKEAFALEDLPVNTFVSVDSKGAVREILKRYQADKSLFETIPMPDLDNINGNIMLQNLKNIRKDMKDNMDTGGETEFWHPFLKKYHWILSQLFIAPYLLFQDEFYVGGTRYDKKGGTVADFGVKNIRTGNCAIIEIKDAKQKLISGYRDKEYRISNELAGAISQALKQKDTLYKEYWRTAYESNKDPAFSANNIKTILIIGTIPNAVVEKDAFELFRNELKGIEIITFDELLAKVELQIQIIEGSVF